MRNAEANLLAMTFYALTDSRLADSGLGEVIEFYGSREEAEEALREVLHDEPGWHGEINVVEIPLLSGVMN
jgi:hypothetical protein